MGLTRSNSGLFSAPGFIVSLSDLSMSSMFGLRSSYMLEYHWLFALFLRSARCFTGVEGKWTPLPPISLPSPHSLDWLSFFFLNPHDSVNEQFFLGQLGCYNCWLVVCWLLAGASHLLLCGLSSSSSIALLVHIGLVSRVLQGRLENEYLPFSASILEGGLCSFPKLME